MTPMVLILALVVTTAALTGTFLARFERKHDRLVTRLRPVVRVLVAEELARRRPDAPAEPEQAATGKPEPVPDEPRTEVLSRPPVPAVPKKEEEAPPPTAAIRAVRGENLDVLLTNSKITFGRGSDRDVVLSASTVSRNHFTMLYRDGLWHVLDEHSPNGTFVNGAPIAPGVPVALSSGDRISASEEVVLLLTTPDPPARDLGFVVGVSARPADAIGDSHCATEDVVALADGEGDDPAGAAASEIAITLARSASAALPLAHLVPAMQAAIRSREGADRRFADMATAFDGVQLLADHRGNRVAGVHIGNGCVFHDDGFGARLLTAEGKTGQALGRTEPEVGTWQEPAVAGHRFVLVTAGVRTRIDVPELIRLLDELREREPQGAAEELVGCAAERPSGRGNARLAAVVVEVGRKKARLLLPSPARPLPLLLP